MELEKRYEQVNRFYMDGKQNEHVMQIDYDIIENGKKIGYASISNEGVEVSFYGDGKTMIDKQLLLSRLFNK